MGDRKQVSKIEILNQRNERIDSSNLSIASDAFVNGWVMVLKLDGVSIEQSKSFIELLRKVEQLKELNKDIVFKWK